MGANPTQAFGIVLFLLAFVLLAGSFAGGGIICAIGFVVLFGISIGLFAKCKPWENQSETGKSSLGAMAAKEVKG